MTGPNPFKPLSVAELMALELPDREWAVDELLPLGSFTLLAAREKAGKSLLMTDLLCSIALGEPFLDCAVRQGPALLIPAEENIRDVRDRIVNRLDGRTDAPIYVLPVNGFTDDRLQLNDQVALARFLATVQACEPVVVGLDPMRELHDLPENESDFMVPLLRPWRQIAHAENISLVMNHHMNRGGTSRGSTGIKQAVDQEWAFRRTDDDQDGSGIVPARGVITIDGRFGPKRRIGVALGPKVRWEPSEAQVEAADGGMRARLLACLSPNGDGLAADDIAAALAANRKTVQNAISKMLKETPPPLVGVGQGTKTDPRRFRLSPNGSHDDSHYSQHNGNDYGNSELTINDSHIPNPLREPWAGNHSEANGFDQDAANLAARWRE